MEPKIPNPSNLSNIRQAAEMALEVLEFYHLEHGTPSKKVLDAISVLRQAISYVDAVNIPTKRVDETAKSVHEPWKSVQCTCGGTIYFKHTKREWVGLTEYQRLKFADRFHISEVAIEAIEAKLKEKNS